jgi:hypothetical protein
MEVVHVVAQTIVVIAVVVLLILAVQCACARYWALMYLILLNVEIILLLEFAQSDLPARLGLTVTLAVAVGFAGIGSVTLVLLYRAMRVYSAHETRR